VEPEALTSGASKYKVLEKLGSGGMGTVFKGLLVGQAGFQRPIVIKQVHGTARTGLTPADAGTTPDPTHLRLFVEEARRYALLDHENIGRIFDFEEVEGELCIIMEYIDGWTLDQYLTRHRAVDRMPGVELSVFIVSRVCRALQYVFERAAIVHRDVSPSNVMMTREGTVKLIDFGIAARSGKRESTLTGKPGYMAPEMIVEMRADNRSDIFSLGVILWELLARERLFTGDSTAEVLGRVLSGEIPPPSQHNPDVPDGVLQILFRALEREPSQRFASAGAMGVACEHYLYDKGYGPTNLTLKHYLGALFPDAGPPLAEAGDAELGLFSELDPELIPIDDGFASVPESSAGGEARVVPEQREEPITRAPGTPAKT
jgi:serine/threonine protein kinase